MTDKKSSRSYTAFMTSSGFAGVRYWDNEEQNKTPEKTPEKTEEAEVENSTVSDAADAAVTDAAVIGREPA